MSNKKSKPLVTPEENIIRLGDLLYAIPGQFKKAEVIDITGGQVSIDTDPLVTISGDNIQELFYSTDEYITFLDQNAVLLITDQTVTGTKTWLDSQVFGTNLVPQGSTQSVGTLAQPFDEGHYTSLYADEIISSGSPGLRLTHGGGAGIIDTTENNDLNIRRFGNSFLKLLASGISLEQDVVMLGNLNVQGTTTSINTEQLLVEDNVITLNHNYMGLPMLDSGLVINRGTENPALFLWDEQADGFIAGISGSEEPITLRSDLIAASGVLQADINTRATYAQLVAASGVLQTDIDSRVLRSGDTMTGLLTLSANPTSNLHASTKQYTDTADNLRVLKSGDTMSGDLLASSTSVDLGGPSNRFGSVYAATFNRPDGDAVLSASDDVIISANGGSGDIFFRTAGGADRWAVAAGGALYPTITNGVLDLGTASRHVNTAYARQVRSDGSGQDLTLMAQDDIFIAPAETTQWTFDNAGTLFPTGNGSRNIGGDNNHVGTVFTRFIHSNSGDLVAHVDNNGKVQLGAGTSSNYANGAFIEVHGNSSGGAGDLRIGAGAGTLRMYAGDIGGSNAIRWQIESDGRLVAANAGSSQEYFHITASNGSYASRIAQLHSSRSPSGLFYFLACGTNNGSNLTHILTGDGNIFIDGSFIDTGADYAEYFEFKDGTPVTTGETVVLDGDKVRAYDAETDDLDDIIGVVRPDGTATATNHPINWPGKYQKDEFGRHLVDENGSKIESPEYDSEQEYVWRSKRPEWAPIGLLGQVQVLKSAIKNPRWRKMKDLSETLELWFIR